MHVAVPTRVQNGGREVTDTSNFIEALQRTRIGPQGAQQLSRHLAGNCAASCKKVDTVRLGLDDRRRLAEEVSRLAGQAQWFADGGGQAFQATASGEAAAYQAQVARNNAIIAGYNATEAEQAGETQAYVTSQTAAAQGGRIKAAQAANNIDVNTGSAGEGAAGRAPGRAVEYRNRAQQCRAASLRLPGARHCLHRAGWT
jgi:hypothetical protein